jgi:hypothetical protein
MTMFSARSIADQKTGPVASENRHRRVLRQRRQPRHGLVTTTPSALRIVQNRALACIFLIG